MLHEFDQVRKGEMFILLSALLWSFFPVITILTFSGVSPLFSAALSPLFAALFFAFRLTWRKEWACLGRRKAWKDILLTSLFIGVILHGLFFLALKITSAGNAAIMGLMEVFFSFFILGLLLKHEPLNRRHILGGACMLTGAAIILLPGVSQWRLGDLLVVVATIFAPFGNRFAQRARVLVSSDCIMFCRSLLSGIILFLLVLWLEPLPSRESFFSSLGFLVVNGILLFGLSKILWLEGIHRIPITKAISLGSIAPALTLIIAFFVLGEPIFFSQILGLLPIIAGIYFLTHAGRKIEIPLSEGSA
ncbi:MAG: DMT family transporter [Candidatus Peribacteraceae bacterium]|nr:DMT family transporter [Candidatus Peribacteraceae bacterium]MDD5074995.1 DMT family transporter [Candidatus Peribacteraceae bacterium]